MESEKMPADWAIEKALISASSSPECLGILKDQMYTPWGRSIIAHARLIEQTQPSPVDRKLLCAREAVAREYPNGRDSIERGEWDGVGSIVFSAQSAITLWEEGFAK